MKKKKKKIEVKTVILCLFLIIVTITFLISGGLYVRDVIRSQKEKEANDKLTQIVQGARDEIQNKDDNPEEEIPIYAESGVLYQYDELWQRNNDMAGWVYIEGTKLDYPVMFTPNEPEYYLRRGFDKKYSYSGTPFLNANWSKDANYAIIYGHHMKNNTMFGGLFQYRNKTYYEQHPTVHFDTLTEENEYEIMAAFYSEVYSKDDKDVFRYYQYTDLSNPIIFNEYVQLVKKYAIYDTGITAEYGDKILTLSTCSYHAKNGRFVVVARKKLAEGTN